MYVFEIINLSARSFFLGDQALCVSSQSDAWFGWAGSQLAVNAIVCFLVIYCIVYEDLIKFWSVRSYANFLEIIGNHHPPYFSLILWAFIVCANGWEQYYLTQPPGWIVFFINLFCYFAILRFWSAVNPCELPGELDQRILPSQWPSPTRVQLLLLLHFGFTACVITVSVRRAFVCDCSTSVAYTQSGLDSVDSLFEILLLGHLMSHAHIEKNFGWE